MVLVADRGDIPTEKITNASGLVVQIDTFLTAGFLVAVFWYWDALSRTIGPPRVPRVLLATAATPFVGFTISAFLSITGLLTGNIEYLEVALYFTVLAVVFVLDAWYSLHSALNSLVPAGKK